MQCTKDYFSVLLDHLFASACCIIKFCIFKLIWVEFSYGCFTIAYSYVVGYVSVDTT